LAYAKNWHH